MADKHLKRKQQRNGLRLSCTNAIAKLTDIFDAGNPTENDLQNILGKLLDYRSRLTVLDNDILDGIDDEEESTAEIARAAETDDQLLDNIVKINTKLQHLNRDVHTLDQSDIERSDSQHTLNSSRSPNVKLPKLNIIKFNGDSLKWQEFWDSYETTIHDNNGLSDIDKFKYLRSFLSGDAFRLVEGYRLTAANYATVVESLAERFGNKQTAIFAHFEAMLALPVANHDTSQLQSVYDECEKHIRSLVALGLPEETFGQVFTPIILSKLPMYVKIELHRRNGSSSWSLSNLRDYLKEEIRARDLSNRSFAGIQASGNRPSQHHTGSRDHAVKPSFRRPPVAQGSSSTLVVNDGPSKPRCTFCSADHYSDQCTKYRDVASRKKQVIGRCYICLSTKHLIKQCPNPWACAHCKKTGHHRSLCPVKFGANSSSTQRIDTSLPVGDVSRTYVSTSRNVSSTLLSHGETVILQTAVATVASTGVDPVNTEQARMLFDTGCSRSFITADLSRKIGARSIGEEVISIAGFRDIKRASEQYKIVQFDVLLPSGKTKTLTANVTNNITCPIQKMPLDPTKYQFLQQMKLAEPPVSTPEMISIDILIGTDYYYDFIGTERFKCSDGLIFLSSLLGFIATGRVETENDSNKTTNAMVCITNPSSILPNNNFHLERYWSLEDIGIKPPSETNDDEVALKAFNEDVTFEEGRYNVSWPWKQESGDIPDNYNLSFGRLKSLMKRIQPNEAVLEQYHQTIQGQREKGVIEEAPATPDNDKVHYIPHHCVITPNKTTTKLRIVYDASAKASKLAPSLNECLHRGPVMLDDLCGLLLRFRLNKVAVVSDIEKAFLQVGLKVASRDVTRFLWVKDPKKPPTGNNLVAYRFTRVPFGVIASPFLLSAVVNHHLEKSNTNAAKLILGNMYVDNVVTGTNSSDNAIKFYEESKLLFTEAAMNLREWYSNDTKLMNRLPKEDRGDTPSTKVLGLVWETSADTLACSSISAENTIINTKRLCLKYLAKVFDPCGYFAPVTLMGKIHMQKLWKAKYDWDDILPDDLVSEWSECMSSLQRIGNHRLQRCIDPNIMVESTNCELHCFCDASAKAYAAVVYLRVSTSDAVTSNVIFAKTRVSPTKVMSIPRLELMAMVVGVRILQFVDDQLKIPITRKVIWSDSQCVLHWVLGKPVSTTFVKNRVNEIKSKSSVKFQYVPTADNPADFSSRGCTTEALICNNIWWHGPPWLTDKPDNWPITPADIDKSHQQDSYQDEYETQSPDISCVVAPSPDIKTIADVTRYSSLGRLLRVTAWVKRFVNNCRRTNIQDGPLQFEELANARLYWDNRTQQQYLAGDRSKWSTTYKQLGLFEDNNGILRCDGRLTAADIPYDAMHPKLLPKNNYYADLIIADCHSQLHHAGVAHTLSQLRYQYWVVQGRSQVKRVLNRCRLCRLYHGPSYSVPNEPPLPDFRVKKQPAYRSVGVDYMGPLYIKDGEAVKKVWICLYTCAVTRAVHLDVVETLSALQFALSLRRFVSLHGRPDVIISDNATNFHKTNNFLQRRWHEATHDSSIQDYSSNNGIRWKFITEVSPWMGGFYERMVGVVKKSLKKSLDHKCSSLVELQTVVTEVAAIVNSRPLLYPDDDPGQPPITPAHFCGGPHPKLPTLNCDTDNYNPKPATGTELILTWARIQSMLDSFWKVWQNQYLLELRNKHTVTKQHNVDRQLPKVGTIVLIKDTLPRNTWKRGIIVTLRVSNDNQCRSATIRLANKKLINRPIKLLFPLEVGNSDIPDDNNDSVHRSRLVRNAARIANNRMKSMLNDSISSGTSGSESDDIGEQ